MDKIQLGSKTAKNGFLNEVHIINKFNNWKSDLEAQKWLIIMEYNLNEIDSVIALKIKGSYKSDVQIQIEIHFKNIIESQNISIKLVSNKSGFNQIDKRWVDKYAELWLIPDDVVQTLKYFCGELKHCVNEANEERRLFLNEFSYEKQNRLIDFINNNKLLIGNDILKGRGKLSAEWMLVVNKLPEESKYCLQPINKVINHYLIGEVQITKKGNLKIGKITMQRKGGDGGRPTANMLQFKFNPNEVFNID